MGEILQEIVVFLSRMDQKKMAACHILGPNSSVYNKLHLVLGFVAYAKKPLHRAGACVTVMKEKCISGAAFQRKKVQWLIMRLNLGPDNHRDGFLHTIAGIKNESG